MTAEELQGPGHTATAVLSAAERWGASSSISTCQLYVPGQTVARAIDMLIGITMETGRGVQGETETEEAFFSCHGTTHLSESSEQPLRSCGALERE